MRISSEFSNFSKLNAGIVRFLLLMCFNFSLVILPVYSEGPLNLEIEYVLGDGGVFNSDLQKIGIYKFFDLEVDPSTLSFVNIYGWNYNGDYRGLSVGGGVRRSYKQWLLGLNIYYDHQLTSVSLNQLGLGFEIYNENNLLYGNVYLPIGKKSFDHNEVLYDDYIGDYWVRCNQKVVVPKTVELVYLKSLFNLSNYHTFLMIGGYGLDYYGCHKYFGGQVGVRVNIYDFMYLEPQVTFDKYSETRFVGKIVMTYPLGVSLSKYSTINRKNGFRIRRFCEFDKNY